MCLTKYSEILLAYIHTCNIWNEPKNLYQSYKILIASTNTSQKPPEYSELIKVFVTTIKELQYINCISWLWIY